MTGIARLQSFYLAFCALPMLASCQTVRVSPSGLDHNDKYIARGNEPGWIVTIDTQNVVYEGDYGQTRITVPAPEGRPSFNGMRYVTDRLTIDITYSSCVDDMSGMRFADTVLVIADEKQFQGCGGRPLPPESLKDTSWSILTIGQAPVLEHITTEIRFADGRVSGNVGCNRFNGPYSVSGNKVRIGNVALTKMMCPENQAAQENQFLELLKAPLTKRFTVEGHLILSDDNANQVILKQTP